MSTELKPMEEKDFSFDANETTHEIEMKLHDSNEIALISQELDINNAQSIMKFGEGTAEEVSKFADKILASMKTTNVEDSGQMLIQLNKIMDKFDVKDFQEQDPNFFEKLFHNTKNSIDKLLRKYENMGTEVDKVYRELKVYENEIEKSNATLEGMFDSNITYYETLQKYIYAGRQVIENIKSNELVALQEKADNSVDQVDQLNLTNMQQAIEMVEQRVFDLELAKSVALQSLPQIKMIQKGNYNLMRKINSAFIVTLPIFKQSLTQAIALKRQGIQAKAMAALDEKTNELLLKNAENTALQAKLTAQLSSGSSIGIETLEETWRTIIEGIEETRRIQNEFKDKREDSIRRLEVINKEFKEKTKLV